MKLKFLSLLTLGLIYQSALAGATLERVKQSQTLVIGYNSESFPFSYQNKEGKIQGFAISLIDEMRAHLAQSQNIPNLQIKAISIDNGNRFDMVNNGTIDLTCTTHSNTNERKQLVNFSYNYFVTRLRLATRADDNSISGYKNLAGKKVAVERSTQASDLVDTKTKQYKFGEIMHTDGSEESLNMLLKGEVDGVFEDDVLLSGQSALMGKSDAIKFVGPALSIDYYACMLPKEDAEFKAAIDEAMANVFLSGKINELFKQWFNEPIENHKGQKVNLNFELGSALKQLYTTPNDNSSASE